MDKMEMMYTSYSPRVVCQNALGFFTRGTIFSSIFNLLTTCIGAGTLSLPYAFAEGGLVFSSVLFFLVMLMSIMVGLYLYDSKRYCRNISPDIEVDGIEDLAQVAFGVVGRIAVLVTLIILLFLSLVAYMVYTRDQLDFVIQFILKATYHAPECSIFTNCAIIMCLGFVPLFPILLLRKMTVLQFTSVISIICIVFVAIMIAINSVIYFDSKHENKTFVWSTEEEEKEQNVITFFPSTVEGAITCLSYCSLTFLCHFQLFSLEKELHQPKKWKLNFIVIATMLIAFVIYLVVAIAGYLQFGGITSEDIMTNYPNDDHFVTSARIALFLTLLFSYPILLHPARAAVNRLITLCIEIYHKRKLRRVTTVQGNDTSEHSDSTCEESDLLLSSSSAPPFYSIKLRDDERFFPRFDSQPNRLVWFCETWVIFGATFLPAAFVPNVGYVWNFVGSIGGSLVLYIFPSLLYIRLRYFIKVKQASQTGTSLLVQYCQISLWKDIIAMLILSTGIIVLAAGNYEAIYAIVKAKHDSQLTICSSYSCVDNISFIES